MILAIALLFAAAPDAAPAAAPDAPVDAPVDAPGEYQACLALLRQGQRDNAAACYRERRALDVASLVGELALRPPDLTTPAPPLTFASLLSSGKGELMATSTVAGAVFGGSLGFLLGADQTPLFPLGVAAGAVLGGSGATLAVLFLPAMTSGDAHFLRACEALGVVDVAALYAASPGALRVSVFSAPIILATGAVGAAGAVLFDLPEAGGSLALSAMLWSGTLAWLASSMFALPSALDVAALVANAAFVMGALASPFVDVTRGETWAADVGGVVGLVGGIAAATFVRAPNPALGYGIIAGGTIVGVGAGLAAARLLPMRSPATTWVDAVAPVAFAPAHDGARPLGVAVAGHW
ncbi:MAG TPA: hypothetical protein VGO62_18125 [Myxococcota bacterium]